MQLYLPVQHSRGLQHGFDNVVGASSHVDYVTLGASSHVDYVTFVFLRWRLPTTNFSCHRFVTDLIYKFNVLYLFAIPRCSVHWRNKRAMVRALILKFH